MGAISGEAGNFNATSYTVTILIYAVVSVPLFYFVYANCKETVKPVNAGKPIPISQSLKAVVTNKPLMLVFAMMLFAMFATFGRLGVVLYYIMYVMGKPQYISLFMSLPSIMTVIGIFLTKNYVIKWGKKRVAAIGYIGSGITLIIIYFVSPTNLPVQLVLHAIYGFFCFTIPIPMSMIPESIDYQEDRIGVRTDGLAYAATSLSTKIGNAFGPAVALLIMGAFGYVGTAQQQTAEALASINFSANLMFGIFYLLALIPLAFYPLNAEKNAKIRASLDAKMAAKNAEQKG